MAEKLSTYDPAEDLGSEEALAVFMVEAFETNDAAYVARAGGRVALAHKGPEANGAAGRRSVERVGLNPTLTDAEVRHANDATTEHYAAERNG